MSDPFGIITIIVSGVVILLSWYLFHKNKIQLGLGCLVLGGLILRVFIISDPYLHEWDERFHALVAKNLIAAPLQPMLYIDPVLPYDYKNWVSNHIWLHKQPVPLWIMSVSLQLFGINEIALRIPSLIISTLGILLIFYTGRELFDEKVGFIASYLFTINGLVLSLTGGRISTDHFDVFFLFFISLGIYLSIRFAKTKQLVLNLFCGLSVGLAILTKWLPALIVLPFWYCMVKSTKHFTTKEIAFQSVILLLTIFVVAAPWQFYIHANFPLEAAWEQYYNGLHLFEAVETHKGNIFYYMNKMRIQYGELVYLPILWLFTKIKIDKIDYCLLGILIWLLVPYVFFSLVATKMRAYTLISGPAIMLIVALFCRVLYKNKKQFKYQWVPQLILIALLILPIRNSLERIKPLQKREKEWMKELMVLKEELKGLNRPLIFNCERPVETMFYIDCIAYHSIPEEKKIEELKQKGYSVILIK